MSDSITSDTILVDVQGHDDNRNKDRILQFKIKAGDGTGNNKDKLLQDLKVALKDWGDTHGITVTFDGPRDT